MGKNTIKEANKLIKEGKGTKGTSIGSGAIKRSTMSKHKKRNYKGYRGQGR